MSKSISEIKAEFEQADREQLQLLYAAYADDSRAGVVSLLAKYKKQKKNLKKKLKERKA